LLLEVAEVPPPSDCQQTNCANSQGPYQIH
jgi:hypothetical protein